VSLSITRDEVKEKASVQNSDYDDAIDNLIETWLAAIEYAVDPTHIANTSDTGLQATLNLAACEMVAGEILAQIDREPGARDQIRVADLWVRRDDLGPQDPSGLKAQGAERVRPFLRSDSNLVASAVAGVQTGGGSKAGENPLAVDP